MEKLKAWDSKEVLEQIKQSLGVDEAGMFTMLNVRIVITTQAVISTIMSAASDLAGLNAAKVFMRRAGYDCAYSLAGTIKEMLKIDGKDLILFYLENTGKRGWGFSVVENIDFEKGIFKGNLHYSPFVTSFSSGTKVPVCDFHAGAVEAMFAAAGNKNVRIIETKCVAKGDEMCVFESKNEE
jgi:predicted hydrocarbon binding protein